MIGRNAWIGPSLPIPTRSLPQPHFTTTGRVAGLTNANGGCNAPLVKGPETPMIHVWIRKNVCGPFAALEGVGAGQIAPGQTKLCDHAPGSARVNRARVNRPCRRAA